ncbi:MAG: GNAT family N-acetyltransferase [bacterium]|nr:GNAT family N-acetyltransferase [bacterium]
MIRIVEPERIDGKKYTIESSSIYFSCIVNDEADGIIWADREKDPDFLLIWSPYQEGFQLMGKPLERQEWKKFRSWFDNTIPAFLAEREMEDFEYGADTQELANMFKEIFQDKEYFSEKQKIFYWSERKNNIKLPEGYEVKQIDRAFFKQEYKDTQFITEEITTAYGVLEPYFSHGIAYVAVKGKEIVARADMLFSNALYGNISVNTKEQHRRKGLSAYLTIKAIEDTCKLGITPIWDCSENNLASEKTAEKCGFKKAREDIIYWFQI